MKTFLVPTDFSQNAAQALHFAADLTRQVNGKLIIVHIINLPVTAVGSEVGISYDAQLMAEGEQQLNALVKNVRLATHSGLEVETICEYGYFMANLNQIVKARKADLVVMGTKGATNFLDSLIGTNTSEFIKQAVCPVLTIPAQAQFKGIKNIVYTADFESEEIVFLQQLFPIAALFNAEVAILNVRTSFQLDIVADEQIMQDIAKHFPDNKYSITQVKENNVITGIQTFVSNNQTDVLAVSIHERSFFESLFHKSVSKQLIYQTTLPLLALPAKPYRMP